MYPRSLHIDGVQYDYVSVSMGAIDPVMIFFRFLGYKCARIWIGTDVLKVTKFFDYRIRAKFNSLFCDNLAVAPWLVRELSQAGIKAMRINYYADINLLSGRDRFENRL